MDLEAAASWRADAAWHREFAGRQRDFAEQVAPFNEDPDAVLAKGEAEAEESEAVADGCDVIAAAFEA